MVISPTYLHHIFYDRSPSGQVVRLLLGTIPSDCFAREYARLKTKAQETISRTQLGLKRQHQEVNTMTLRIKNSSIITEVDQFLAPSLTHTPL